MFSSRLTKRPRDVNFFQAASILYGDWGTSKAYVIGLAFALTGYSSFWLMACLAVLNIVVALNYVVICRCYPGGGGVYASVQKRSKLLALVAAFFLVADYLVTASLSSLAAFNYLGVAHPLMWSVVAIFTVGILNYLGPRHTGNLAFIIAIPTVIVCTLLAYFSLPFLGEAIANLQPLEGSFAVNWVHFVSVVVGMSGIEAIANTTGVMKLNKGGGESVTNTSTPAIISVMLEVTIFTTFFALVTMALPNLTLVDGNIDAPGHPGIRDYLLRFVGETFVGTLYTPHAGMLFGYVVSLVFCVLLLSAVNTAIVALVSLFFVMSRDGTVPSIFQKLNGYGVPIVPLMVATVTPVFINLIVNDVAGLADLYAVGFVGAIATNLGSTSTDKRLPMRFYERIFMFSAFLVMAAIEMTLFVSKPDARNFAILIMCVGLFLRALVQERQMKQAKEKKLAARNYAVLLEEDISMLPKGAILCAVTHVGKTLKYALENCQKENRPLYILYIRSQQTITEEDQAKSWTEDPIACEVFDFAVDHMKDVTIHFLYTVSDSTTNTIVEYAKTLDVSRVILGHSRHPKLFQVLRGNIVHQVTKLLPESVDLITVS